MKVRMRHIIKVLEPSYFTEAKKKVKSNGCSKDPWDGDDNIAAIRSKLRKYIAENEQNNCCAYCELPIKVEDSTNCDIEHFRKRNIFNKIEEILDYNNLIVSCKKCDHCSNYKDKHMSILPGEGKEKYVWLINPIVDRPEIYFVFQKHGRIVAKHDLNDKDKQKANYTIELFNLNDKALVRRRQEIFKTLDKKLDLGPIYKNIEQYSQEVGCRSFLEVLYSNEKLMGK